jgi:large subunit ribosomal protein L19
MSNVRPIIEELEQRAPAPDFPDFRVGDTVRVHVRIVEGDKERVQVFEGVCIRRRRGGNRGTFTVRKVSYGVGVERTFPYCAPRVEKVEIRSRGRVRRGRLYYLRDRRGKAARIREKIRPSDKRKRRSAERDDNA